MAADILLSFGVATSDADVSEIQKGLQTIISKIEKNPPQVRVGLTVDDDALKGFTKKLEGVLKTLSLANGAPISLKIDGLGEISSDASKATKSLDSVGKAAKDASADTRAAFNAAKSAVNGYFKALADVDKRLGQDIFFDPDTKKWSSATKEFQYLADALTEAEQRFNTFASAEARAALTAEQQEELIRITTDAYNKYGIAVEDAHQRARIAADKAGNQAALKAEAEAYKDAESIVKEYYSLLAKVNTGDNDIRYNGIEYISTSGRWSELATALNKVANAYRLVKEMASSLSADNQTKFLDLTNSLIQKYNIAVEASRAKADVASEKRSEADAYSDAVRVVREYYELQTKLAKLKDHDIVLDGPDGKGYVSSSGQYAELSRELNRTKVAYDAVINAISNLAPEHQAALQALLTQETIKYNRAVEETANKERIAAKTAKENADRRTAAKEAIRSEADAFNDASRIVKEYYSTLARFVKAESDIVLDGSEYVSPSGNYSELAKELNRTKVAYDAVYNSRKALSEEHQVKLIAQIAKEQRNLNAVIEDYANKKRIAAEAEDAKASSSSAAKSEAEAYENAARAVNEYYSAFTKVAKSDSDIIWNGTEYKSTSGNYSKLAEELNRVSEAYRKVIASLSELSDEDLAKLASLDAQKLREYNLVVEEQANKERKAAEATREAAEEARRKSKETLHSTATVRNQIQQLDRLIKQNEANLSKWSSAAKDDAVGLDYQAIQQQVDKWKNMRAQIFSTGTAIENFNDKINASTIKVARHSAAIKNAGKDTKTFGDHIKGLVGKFASWLTISQSVMFVVRTLKKMVTTVMDLDAAMTELKKVTNETDAAYERFLTNASARAKELGASLSDVVSSTADFSRLGYSVDEASEMADAALVYKNVGDGITDVNEASESLISTMQAFGVEANNVMSIVDKFNNVGNRYAISSKGIGDALLNSASALAAANNTLDESIALITAANTTIQNPEKVGTALRSVSMYIRAAKQEAEDAGIATDGMASSVSELREQILSLTKGQVDIMVSDTEFKSTYQIIKEIANVWNSLQETDQSLISELLGGGVRNFNVVSALVRNFQIAEDSLADSMNSAGSAMRENEVYLSSIAGELSKFQSSWEALSATVVNSEIVKFVVRTGTAFLDLANSIAKLVGNLGALCAAIPLSIAAFEKFKVLQDIWGTIKSLAGGAK